MTTSSTTPPAAAPAGPSTKAETPRMGDLVLVRLDRDLVRPMLVTSAVFVPVGVRTTPTVENPTGLPGAVERRLSGVLFCEPDDHTAQVFRTVGVAGDPARVHGRPDRQLPIAYGEYLRCGTAVGQWSWQEEN